mmetsp:Transcript_122075/g.304654  ORF Transcript_122075/g.304654 Transcript_122075/m.304654 type:complete len:230 (+) Transcript_122075:132-821(+)
MVPRPSRRRLSPVALDEAHVCGRGAILCYEQVPGLLEDLSGDMPLSGLVVEVGHAEASEELHGVLLSKLGDVRVPLEELCHDVLIGPSLCLLPPHLEAVPALLLGARQRAHLRDLYSHVVQVQREDLEDPRFVLDGHAVDLPALCGNKVRQEIVHRVRDHDRHPVVLRGLLQPCCRVDVRAEIGRVDLEFRSDCPLDGPAAVQAQAQTDAVVWQALGELWVAPILGQQW